MTLPEITRAMRKLRVSGMAATLETRIVQAQADHWPPRPKFFRWVPRGPSFPSTRVQGAVQATARPGVPRLFVGPELVDLLVEECCGGQVDSRVPVKPAVEMSVPPEGRGRDDPVREQDDGVERAEREGVRHGKARVDVRGLRSPYSPDPGAMEWSRELVRR